MSPPDENPAAPGTPAPRPLQEIFTAVPPAYDLLNRMLTFGLDQRWRRHAAAACLLRSPARVLDLCCGTGDLALCLRRLAPPGTRVSALDFSPPMLARAARKAAARGLPEIDFRLGDAAALPFPDGHFQALGIAFAFRNLTFRNPDREAFLSEIRRVLEPGGRLVIVETSQPARPPLRALFHAYLRWVSAPLGGLVSGHRGAYRYLAYSAANYWSLPELTAFLLAAGFSRVAGRPLCGGIAALAVAER